MKIQSNGDVYVYGELYFNGNKKAAGAIPISAQSAIKGLVAAVVVLTVWNIVLSLYVLCACCCARKPAASTAEASKV